MRHAALFDHVFDRSALRQDPLDGSRRGGEPRDENAAAAGGFGSKAKRIPALVANVIAAVHRCCHPAEAFLFYGAQKIARIGAAMQTWLRDWRRVKAALECETA